MNKKPALALALAVCSLSPFVAARAASTAKAAAPAAPINRPAAAAIPVLPISLTQPAAALIAALSAAPAGVSRDVAVTAIPPASFAAMESKQVGALLSLIAWPGAYETGNMWGPEGAVPAEAWRNLSAEDLKTLLSKWDGVNWSRAYSEDAAKRQILKAWKAANAGR